MTATGPFTIALAVWCAAGRLTVASDASAVDRLAVPAPMWVPLAAFVLAMLVPGWRRHPVSAAPALFAVLPWIPLPLPPIALVWTGPLAWAPIGLALIAAIMPQPSSPADRSLGPGAHATTVLHGAPASALAHATLAAVLTLALSIATAWSLAPHLPRGDEPHYLVITQSLLYDGDLDIGNNHDKRDYLAYVSEEMDADVLVRGRRGEAYSIHAPGVAALVLPGFAAFGYPGAQATMLMLSALTAALLWSIGWRATGDLRAAWFACAAMVLTPTFLFQSATVFPDGPAALIVAAALRALMQWRDRGRPLSMPAVAGVAAALAALPWLHARLAALAGLFGAGLCWTIARGAGTTKTRALATFIAVAGISAAAWFSFFYLLYGTFRPTAPYGRAAGETSIAFVPGAIAGLLFDQQFGIVAFAPVLAAAAAGALFAVRSAWRAVAVTSGAAAGAYLIAVGMFWMWWAGVPAPPARLLMPVLPLAVLPLALAWRRGSANARRVMLFALAWSAAVTACVIGVGRGDLTWNVRDGQALWLNWINPVVNLPRGWPSFFWDLTPGIVSSERPFAVHAAFVALAAATLLTLTMWWCRRAEGARSAAALASGLLVIVMAVVQIGWWLNRTNGLDPARSQLSVMGAISRGRAALLIQPPSLRSGRDALRSVIVRPEERPKFRTDVPWAQFADVPAGEYDVSIAASHATTGEIAVFADGRELARRSVESAGQALRLSLPAGARMLTFEAIGLNAAASVALRRR